MYRFLARQAHWNACSLVLPKRALSASGSSHSILDLMPGRAPSPAPRLLCVLFSVLGAPLRVASPAYTCTSHGPLSAAGMSLACILAPSPEDSHAPTFKPVLLSRDSSPIYSGPARLSPTG